MSDLTGREFGRWTVIGFDRDVRCPCGKKISRWFCRCKCGTIKSVLVSSLTHGLSRSCGCLQKEAASALASHGKSGSSIYRRWHAMIQRCTNPNDGSYKRYGGRGIGVHPKWLEFTGFYTDVGDPPFVGASLDRIDNDGDYCPGNVRWASRRTQQNNLRSNRVLTLDGVSRSVTEWSRILGINPGTLRSRIRYGWPDKRILTEPIHMECSCLSSRERL